MAPKSDDTAKAAALSAEQQAQARQDAWSDALDNRTLPGFVKDRLQAASERKIPWLSTTTPAELLLVRSHGLRPLATVSGTCWFHYGFSWTQGHAEGWETAIVRMKREALAVGANAVVDVQMRTVKSPMAGSMDFTVFGTAVKFDSLPPSKDPVLATVPAMDFVRLLEMGISVCGIAIGASYDYLEDNYAPGSYTTSYGGGRAYQVQQQLQAFGGNTAVASLTGFWERIRREAHAQLRQSAARSGNGVLAKTNFGQLIPIEREKMPPNYLGRHIVIGTTIDARRGDAIPHHIMPVVDMRDELSPLKGGTKRSNDFEGNNEHTGGI